MLTYNIGFWNEADGRYDETQFDVDDGPDVLAALCQLFCDFREENGLPSDTVITYIDNVEV